MREPAWRKTGTTPDYRFSLANERTFLAWIRTSLALIAGALAIDQLAPEIAPGPVRIVLCVILAFLGAGLAALSYHRWGLWRLPCGTTGSCRSPAVMLVMTIGVAAAALVFAVLILVAR